MTTKTDKTNVQEAAGALGTLSGSEAPELGKKEFVEPQISAPVDVLEATTFFITGDSGASESVTATATPSPTK